MIGLIAQARRLPGWVWGVLAAVLAVAALMWWHEGRLRAAREAGAVAQAVVDRAPFEEVAAAAHGALVVKLAARQAAISKGTNDELAHQHANLARRYDDLRLRWSTAGAGARGAEADGAAALSSASRAADDAACVAGGCVDFNTASAAAEAADAALAKDDAWIAWTAGQAAAWPQGR